MRLAELAREVPGARLLRGGGFQVERVTQDSRQAGPGTLFVAVRGLRVDGHAFCAAAAAAGAAVAVSDPAALGSAPAGLLVADGRAALGEAAAVLRGRPARRLWLAGVTGTDGKTSVTHLAGHLLRAAGIPAAEMSTVAVSDGRRREANRTGLTTTDPVDIQEWLAAAVAAGSRAAVLEVSSIALDQRRVAGCEFDVAVITNLGSDHLDYHGTVAGYHAAKAGLIALAAASAPKGIAKAAVLNADDPGCRRLMEAGGIARTIGYGLDHPAEIGARNLSQNGQLTRFQILLPGGAYPAELAMPGRFNVSNALAAVGVGLALGAAPAALAAGLASFPGVPGRMERVDLGQPFEVVIDYAHAASALEAVLRELRARTRGRLIAVFGATARSDHDPAGMGAAAAALADRFIVTTDDPLDRDPAELAATVLAGVKDRVRGRDYEVELDRAAAIERAVAWALPGDTVLLAGKGHETVQRIGGENQPWSEREVAESAIRGRM